MYTKVCTSCSGDSYSSYHGNWICPYCGTDLSTVKPELAGRDNNEVQEYPFGRVVLFPPKKLRSKKVFRCKNESV